VNSSETQRVPAEFGRSTPFYEFVRRALGALLIASLFALLFLFLFYTIRVLLLIGAGVMLAVFLRSLAGWVTRYTRASDGLALAIVLVLLIALFGSLSWWLQPEIVAQVQLLLQRLPESLRRIRDYLEQTAYGSLLLQQLPEGPDLNLSYPKLFSQTVGALSTLIMLITDTIVVLFVGIYLAAEPDVYAEGVARLAPPAKRQRVLKVIDDMGRTLRWWLAGRFISLAYVGVFSGIGYWLLGIPLALTLAILAGVFTFIPNIGPLLSSLPAVLLAFSVSPATAIWVIVVIIVVQASEGYLIAPVVQRRTILLPPAVVIAAQVLMGLTLGALALFLATPLAAVLMVLVEELYIQGVLKDTATTPE
jgi:predicted PurR-regulated permease PerM